MQASPEAGPGDVATGGGVSWARIWRVSASASLLGSIFGTIVLLVPNSETIADFFKGLLISPLILLVGLVFSLPTGLAFGLPILRLFGSAIHRRPAVWTVLLGLVGAGAGWVIGLTDAGGLEGAPLYFGGFIGALHALLFAKSMGSPNARLAMALVAAVALVPAICVLAADAYNLHASKQQFERACSERSGYLGRLNDDVDPDQMLGLRQGKGSWYRQGRHSSLYARRSAIRTGERAVLFANDYAYVPQGIVATLTGGRRIARHCLSEITGPQSELMREHGLGQRPTLSDLAD